MRWVLLTFIFVFNILYAHSHAAPAKVGPKDGMVVESLAPIATPDFVEPEKMVDFTFPQNLEKAGDFSSALYAWQKTAHESSGADLLRAKLGVLRLHTQLGNTQAAQTLAGQLLTQPLPTEQADQVRFFLVQNLQGDARKEALKPFIENRTSAWADAALYNEAFREGWATGKINKTYGLDKAQTLYQRLTLMEQEAKTRAASAAAMSIVPGLGHMVLQDNATSGILLTVWALLGLAFISACRHKHFSYAFVFAIPFAALWVSAAPATLQIAQEQATHKRQAAMQSWAEFLPTYPRE